MIIKTEDYIIDSSTINKVIISGSMRLPSPLSYDQPFALIKKALDDCIDTLNIDLQDLEYLMWAWGTRPRGWWCRQSRNREAARCTS